jgi:hypothetical protein
MSSFKVVPTRDILDRLIIGGGIFKHKVANLTRSYAKLLQRFDDKLAYPLTSMRAWRLWQRDEQVNYLTRNISVVCNNAEEATFAAFCRPAVKAYVDERDRT